jgi:hypothetical protein
MLYTTNEMKRPEEVKTEQQRSGLFCVLFIL